MSHVNETKQNFLSSSVQMISKKYRVYFLYYSLGSREAFGTLPRLYRIRLKLMHFCNYYKPSAKFDQAKCHFIYRSRFNLQTTDYPNRQFSNLSIMLIRYQQRGRLLGNACWITFFRNEKPPRKNRKFSQERNENKAEAKQHKEHTNTKTNTQSHMFASILMCVPWQAALY